MAQEEKKEDKKALKPRRPQAQKRNIQNEKRRLRNRAFKSQVRTALRQFEDSISKAEPDSVKQNLNAVYSLVDKGVKRGLFKVNTASRIKARMASKIRA